MKLRTPAEQKPLDNAFAVASGLYGTILDVKRNALRGSIILGLATVVLGIIDLAPDGDLDYLSTESFLAAGALGTLVVSVIAGANTSGAWRKAETANRTANTGGAHLARQ